MANTKQAPILHHGCSKQQVIIDTKSNFYQKTNNFLYKKEELTLLVALRLAIQLLTLVA